MKIVIYTSNSCPKCKRAKEMLKNCPVEVELELRNVDEEPTFKDDLVRFRSMSLPTLLIESEDGFLEDIHGQQWDVLTGFEENMGRIMEYLGL